jgi:hypothetical protein
MGVEFSEETIDGTVPRSPSQRRDLKVMERDLAREEELPAGRYGRAGHGWRPNCPAWIPPWLGTRAWRWHQLGCTARSSGSGFAAPAGASPSFSAAATLG